MQRVFGMWGKSSLNRDSGDRLATLPNQSDGYLGERRGNLSDLILSLQLYLISTVEENSGEVGDKITKVD